MIAWWWLILAFVCGGIGGVAVMCLCCAAKEADREVEEMERRIAESGRF
jgi:hypothetical protein